MPKVINDKKPAKGYHEDRSQRRFECELRAKGVSTIMKFAVFGRQHKKFPENFSLGLRFQTADKEFGSITLIRYNGPHGKIARASDGHFSKPHIHRITATELASGTKEPQERHRTVTNRYSTYEQAIICFFEDIAVSNSQEYFPELSQQIIF